MIKVWTDGVEAGLMDRLGEHGSTFAYTSPFEPYRAVSMTMPSRLQSWDETLGLAPVFEMNLPEGLLRERLRLAFAKTTGTFDDLDLLSIVGRSQVGRIRYTGPGDALDETIPFQSVDEILEGHRGGTLYRYLIEKFAQFSGISGVQPKVLVRDSSLPASATANQRGIAPSHRGATHIVKFWEPGEFPQLAANEYFCLRVAERCGLNVPRHRLSEDGRALVIDRFDLRPDGTYCGFEDFCVLNDRRTDQKYLGSYESSILKRFKQFADLPHQVEDLETLFKLIALNCALRNGDAHLKNFGVRYDDVLSEARLAPAYDLVTTTVYLPQDTMALTLNGTVAWPTAKVLRRCGEASRIGSRSQIHQLFERISDALSDVASEVETYRNEHPLFAVIGGAMLQQWELGRQTSLLPE